MAANKLLRATSRRRLVLFVIRGVVMAVPLLIFVTNPGGIGNQLIGYTFLAYASIGLVGLVRSFSKPRENPPHDKFE